MNKQADPRIIVLTAPSGSGKTTIARRLLDSIEGLHFSVSATTRPRRPQEKDGVHYHFLSTDEFDKAKRDGRLLEYEEVYPGCEYGTLMTEVERSSADQPVLLDVDVKGAENVKRLYADRALVIFIHPPSFEVLEKRLRRRRTESVTSLEERLRRARLELGYSNRFDAVVVNDDLDDAVREAEGYVKQFLDRPLSSGASPGKSL